MRESPYSVLGLAEGADKQEVKRAFRALALQYHPDLNPAASEEYERVRNAADKLLNKATRTMQSGAEPRTWAAEAAAISRHSRFPLYISVLGIVGGCAIFAGAVHVHRDLYNYNVHKEVEHRRKNPTPAQERIKALILEKQNSEHFAEPVLKPP